MAKVVGTGLGIAQAGRSFKRLPKAGAK